MLESKLGFVFSINICEHLGSGAYQSKHHVIYADLVFCYDILGCFLS